MSIFNFGNPLKINAPVGNNRTNHDEDVRTLRVGLETLGYFGESERERDVYGRPLGMITAGLITKPAIFNNAKT